MSKINNITALRQHAIETLEKLSAHEIDTAEAGVTGKLCEGVISTLKTQMEYHRMLGEEPSIEFMQEGHGNSKLIESHNEPKALPFNKR